MGVPSRLLNNFSGTNEHKADVCSPRTIRFQPERSQHHRFEVCEVSQQKAVHLTRRHAYHRKKLVLPFSLFPPSCSSSSSPRRSDQMRQGCQPLPEGEQA